MTPPQSFGPWSCVCVCARPSVRLSCVWPSATYGNECFLLRSSSYWAVVSGSGIARFQLLSRGLWWIFLPPCGSSRRVESLFSLLVAPRPGLCGLLLHWFNWGMVTSEEWKKTRRTGAHPSHPVAWRCLVVHCTMSGFSPNTQVFKCRLLWHIGIEINSQCLPIMEYVLLSSLVHEKSRHVIVQDTCCMCKMHKYEKPNVLKEIWI